MEATPYDERAVKVVRTETAAALRENGYRIVIGFEAEDITMYSMIIETMSKQQWLSSAS